MKKTIKLPAGKWTLVGNGKAIDQNGFSDHQGAYTVPAITAMILKQD